MHESIESDADALAITRIAASHLDERTAADALGALYRRHGAEVGRYLVYLTGDREYAEEVHQDVFLAVWLGAGSFDGRASVRGWLYAIARRRVRDGCRRHQLQVVDDDCLLGTESQEPPIEQVALVRLEWAAVRAAIETLRPHHREVLTLAAAELSMRDLAAVLDVPIGTVKRWLCEARRALGRAVEEARR